MPETVIDFLGEGSTDDFIARKLIQSVGASPGLAWRTPLSGSGKSSLDKRLLGLNAGQPHRDSLLLVLRDLDNDASCPSALSAKLVPNRHPNLILRICVRESESWLLADADAYAKYCGVSASRIPDQTDLIDDPKKMVVEWGRQQKSTKLNRYIREAENRGVPAWAILVDWNLDFIERYWDPGRAAAAGRSNSLFRSLNRLRTLV